MQYYVDGKQVRESTKTEARTAAEQRLRARIEALNPVEDSAVKGRSVKLKNDGAVLTIGKSDFESLLKPCVYVFYHGNIVLYVGSGACAARPLGSSHHQRLARSEADKIVLHTCESVTAARRLEAAMILKLKPTHNRRGELIG